MVCRSYMFFNLLLSSYSLEYGVKKYITDISGYSGINPRWYSPCPNTWGAVTNARLNACFPKRPDTQFCVLLSSSYNISKVNNSMLTLKLRLEIVAQLEIYIDALENLMFLFITRLLNMILYLLSYQMKFLSKLNIRSVVESFIKLMTT